jgi:hypothetical protein
MFDNLGAEPRQGIAQGTFADVLDHRFSRSHSLGGWGPFARRLRPARHRPLPQGKSVDAGKAQVAIDAFNHNRGKMLQFKREPGFDPHHQCRRRVLGPRGAAGRPFQRQRLGHGREPFADDILPIKDDLRLAEALPGEDRIDRPRAATRANEAGVSTRAFIARGEDRIKD